ncbi:phosphoethanolamine transferase [Ramlibacter sp. MAHUQ-53]|uniref:phosphoethanolamine transferase n=1 Tax=unclassified Ramlibacter TaxID=2617605 RepID=UPI00362B73BF
MTLSPRRPLLSVETLILLSVAWLLATANGPFWRAALAGRDLAAPATWGFAAALAGLLGGLSFAALALVSARWSVRPLLAALLVASAGAAWYMDRYAIYVDRAMVRNVLATHVGEARELLSWRMAAHVAVFGLLPAAALWWPRLAPRTWRQAAAWRGASVALALLLAVAAILPVFADFASLMRNRKEVRHLATPGNLVAALAGNAWGRTPRTAAARIPVGADAQLAESWGQRRRPLLFVLVVGETARAQNFGLNGYARDTTPELAARGVVNFPDAWACGTSTEVSLPCMFSPFGRRRYDEDRILSHESLLHVLARAGLQVQWRDNQSGCKGVCQGLPEARLDHAGVEGLCPEGQCLDEILVHGMDRVLADAKGNLFVVLHQLGNHGPAYYRRYPAAFRRFTPACESDDLRLCSPAEIRNAYDNALLYTDHVLGRVIDFLRARQDRWDTAMLYLSDHGESLGESGLYLHGVPHRVAPEVQLRVPMVAWMSPGFRASFGVDEGCLRRVAATRRTGHDDLFHSVLGLLDVRTAAYEREQDLFAPCRPVPGGAGAPPVSRPERAL